MVVKNFFEPLHFYPDTRNMSAVVAVAATN